MAFWNKKKTTEELYKEAADALAKEELYAIVLQEIESGQRRDGLWAQALSKAEFDEAKAKSIYLELRVHTLALELMVNEDEYRKQEEVRYFSDIRANNEVQLDKDEAELNEWEEDIAKLKSWYGYDPAAQQIDDRTKNGMTLLHRAIKDGDIERVQVVLSFGANVRKDYSGESCLSMANRYGGSDMISLIESKLNK